MGLYLDNSATTPLSDSMREYIKELLITHGNPSSTYSMGQYAAMLINNARESVANFINADPSNIHFSSGGSSSNAGAIHGFMQACNNSLILYDPTAHKSMLMACQHYDGLPLYVNENGEVDIEYLTMILEASCTRNVLVCINATNSEIGTVQNIYAIDELCRRYNQTLLLDCTQYITTFPIDVQKFKSKVMISFSGHKLNALKGVGVLYKNPNIDLIPLIWGSQDTVFGGTENVLGICSLGKACQDYDYSHINNSLIAYLWSKINNEIENTKLIGKPIAERAPHNLFIAIDGIRGEQVLILLDILGYQVSTGSACNSADGHISPTLESIGLSEETANSCIRITLSGYETIDELDKFVIALKDSVGQLRQFN